MYQRMNNICIIHGNNICRNDVFERRKKIRKYNSLVTCLHNIFQISEFSFPYDKQNLRNEEAKEKHEKEIYLLSSKSDWKRNGNRPIRIDNRRFPSKHPSPQHTKVQYKVSPFAEVGQFPRPHDHRVAWSLGNVGSTPKFRFIQRREFEKIVFDTVSRRGIANRVPVVRHEASKRDRFETRDESFGLSTPPAAYMYTRAVSSVLRREMALWGEKVGREERERERSFLLWN